METLHGEITFPSFASNARRGLESVPNPGELPLCSRKVREICTRHPKLARLDNESKCLEFHLSFRPCLLSCLVCFSFANKRRKMQEESMAKQRRGSKICTNCHDMLSSSQLQVPSLNRSALEFLCFISLLRVISFAEKVDLHHVTFRESTIRINRV